MGRHNKATFRDGTYYRHVLMGKRTVKEGECAAVWTASGKRHVIEGPRRIRLWWSHVRFLHRSVADHHEYLVISFRNGAREHRRGPCAMFKDPCVHESVVTVSAYKLGANEAVVVYSEKPLDQKPLDQKPGSAAVAANTATSTSTSTSTGATQEGGKSQTPVGRRIVHGPAVYVPRHDEWVHSFSWHGTPPQAGKPGQGSKTGRPNDDKVPHASNFTVLRQMPDQMYCTVRDVRTKDDAQIAVHLMIFYELVDIEGMLDSSNDPIGDFINAASADVMAFGASNTYESLLEQTDQLSDLQSFPTAVARMSCIGYKLLNVAYRGYSTSAFLQEMHDDAIAKRTKLRLQSATARVEAAEQSMLLKAKEERAEGERSLESAGAKHKLEVEARSAEQQRTERDADHEQRLRHESDSAEARLKKQQQQNDEEVRRATALQALGVDLTKLLCVAADRQPNQHVRIDSATPTNVHLEVAK